MVVRQVAKSSNKIGVFPSGSAWASLFDIFHTTHHSSRANVRLVEKHERGLCIPLEGFSHQRSLRESMHDGNKSRVRS